MSCATHFVNIAFHGPTIKIILPILILTQMCSVTTDDHADDDDTVTALDLRIVKASESVDLFSDRDVLADDASRSGPIRTREQQGLALISLKQTSTKLGVLKCIPQKYQERRSTLHTAPEADAISIFGYQCYIRTSIGWEFRKFENLTEGAPLVIFVDSFQSQIIQNVEMFLFNSHKGC